MRLKHEIWFTALPNKEMPKTEFEACKADCDPRQTFAVYDYVKEGGAR